MRISSSVVLPHGKPPDHVDREPIEVRQVRPGDAPAIAEFFRNLSLETVYYRYFSASRPSAEAAYCLANCDHRTIEAIIAEAASGSIVGVMDCYRHGEGCAEIGIVVADTYQSRGVGSRLLHAAMELFEARGIMQLDGDILPENCRMRRWMREVGAHLRFDGGTIHFRLPLQPVCLPLQPAEYQLPRAA
jgi:acetyltransferase